MAVRIAEFKRPEDAAFALWACNAHDELVEALERCALALDASGQLAHVKIARDAIAKATG